MKNKYLLLSFILLLLSIGAFQPFGCLTTITGTVSDTSSQKISGATVSINAEGINDVPTNSDGIYEFKDVPYGDYIISAVHTGYIQSSTTVTSSYFTNGLFGGEIDVADIQLVAEEEEEEEEEEEQEQTYNWQGIGNSASSGGVSNSQNPSKSPYLGINGYNDPVVAWHQYEYFTSGDDAVYFKQWNGSSWENLGGSIEISDGDISGSSAGMAYLSLMINNIGNPVVTWFYDSNAEIYLKQWNGSSWEELGGSASGGGVSNTGAVADYHSLTIDNSGNPVVAWRDVSSGNIEIYLKQWNGSIWEELGGSASTGGVSNCAGDIGIGTPPVAINGLGNPVVAWRTSSTGIPKVYLKQWNGTSWEELDGSATGAGVSNTSVGVGYLTMAINNSGYPVIAWEDYTPSPSEIYVKQWNGSTWEELDGSATGGGVSNTSGTSSDVSIAVDASGYPIVAWNENVSGQYEIYAKRWDGSNWVEIDGSASGGGISNNSENSTSPSIVINNSGNPVITWSDYSFSSRYDIYLKQYAPDN